MTDSPTGSSEISTLATELFGSPNDQPAILVQPGLPANLSKPDGDRPIYPSNTVDIAKMLKAEGFKVEFPAGVENRELVGHFAADEWLPILQFASSMFAGASGNLLSGVIERLFRRRSHDTVVHIDWNVVHVDGSVESFKFDGPVRAAKNAADIFESSLKRRHGSIDD